MSVQSSPTLSPETQAMLYCLQQAVANALECKRRLGQYAIFGSGNAAIAVSEDAPVQLKAIREPYED